jgi:hypothetical protein
LYELDNFQEQFVAWEEKEDLYVEETKILKSAVFEQTMEIEQLKEDMEEL